jgi:hypothetical protein
MMLHSRILLVSLALWPFEIAHAFTPEKSSGCARPTGVSAFSKCIETPNQEQVPSESNAYCLPATDVTSTLPSAFTVEKLNSHGLAVASISVKNCRSRTGSTQGDFVVVVDNSKSACLSVSNGTDCSGERGVFAKRILDTFANGSNKVGVISYGGREGTITEPTTYTGDPLNKIDPDITKIACRNNDVAGSEFSPYSNTTTRSPEPWAAESSGILLSRCELIPINTNSARANSFIDFTLQNPRGATDFSYFLDASQRSGAGLLGDSTATSKNLIVITDGLPNIPKRIPRATCEKSSILMSSITEGGGKFFVDSDGHEYCLDRQFKLAAETANKYTEGLINFQGYSTTGTQPFASINVYNLLFVSNGLAYSDVDYTSGERLYPDDFLIENSARTGNGKVKFSYIRGANAEAQKTSFLESLSEFTDAHAIQRVVITVNGTTYNAVSTGSFSKKFDLKLVGLVAGANTVKIETYYSDSTIPTSSNLAVNVTSVSAFNQRNCTAGDMNQTVDGDDPAKSDPAGDGVLPYITTTGQQCRVFRNADASNARDLSSFYTQNYAESDRAKAARLRFQGGTGNCGALTDLSGRTVIAVLLLLALPIFALLTRSKKRP